MGMNTRLIATNIGQNLAGDDAVKFPIELIVPIADLLIQFLGTCWKSSAPAGISGATNPADYLRDHYDPEADKFEDVVVGQVRGQTRRAIRTHARQVGGTRLKMFSQDDITRISTDSLKQIMNSPQALASCLAEVDSL